MDLKECLHHSGSWLLAPDSWLLASAVCKTAPPTRRFFIPKEVACPFRVTPAYSSGFRYIHRNPVRAAICISVKDYPWSSDRFYRKMESGFVEFGLLLDMLSANSKQSVRKYSQLMEQDDNYVPEKLAITENTSPEGLNQSKEINGGRRPLDEILMDTGINGEELVFTSSFF